MPTIPTSDFDTSHLRGPAKKVADAIVELIRKDKEGEEPYGGGCRAFYSPKEWRDRGEEYGRNSVLILVHDGGDLARYCNYDYNDYDAIERISAALKPLGFYVESCTCWYAAVHKL